MRLFPFILLCGSLLALVLGFTKEDHEIFRLKDEIVAAEGSEVTFYDFLGVKSSASQEQIVKASRKKGRSFHPDKAKQSLIAARAKATSKPLIGTKKKKPGVNVNKAPSESEIQAAIKQAEKRYARLVVITEILKGPGRERYDFFLSTGFPAWRGTGYYYARFRPGLGTVLFGLFTFGGGAVHYGVLYLSWTRHREFVERIIRDARKMAWGDESGIGGIPGIDGAMMGKTTSASPSTFAQENGAAVLNRRQKRMQERESRKEEKKSKGKGHGGTSTPNETETISGPQGTKKRVVAPNGKVMIVDSVGNVFLEEEDENGEKQEFLLDPNELPKPTIRQTVLVRLPVWAFSKIRSKVSRAQENYEEAELKDIETTDSEEEKKPKLNGNVRKKGRRNAKN